MRDLSPSSRPAPNRELDAVAAGLQRAIASAPRGWTLLWAAAPTALLDLHNAPAPRSRRASLADGAKTTLAGFGRGRGATLVMVDDVLFAYEGANPGATLRPVIDRFAQARAVRPVDHVARPSLAEIAQGIAALRHAEGAARRELRGSLPEALTRALHAAVRARARAVRTLDALRPRLLVLASQHSTSSRSLIRAARDRSIATAYLPHAPVGETYQYRDLPTEFAGVRGVREVEFYRSLGAVRDAAVVGNPQGIVRRPEHLDPSGPVIYAPRPQAPEQVRAQVRAVDAAAPEVVVSPHPRMRGKARYDGLWPDHWAVHDGWTIDLLQEGYPCLIQRSSGVAWEALAHGVPVIELATDSSAPSTYLVSQEPYVRWCGDADDLPAAVAGARAAAGDATARERLTSWAAEWCAATGDAAVRRAAEWVESCATAPRPDEPLLDRWAPDQEAA
jgi:hypothetical protein